MLFLWLKQLKQLILYWINLKKEKTGQRAEITGRGFTLFISNGDMDDVIKIVESWEQSGIVIDGAIKTVNHEIKKKQEGEFLPVMMAPMAPSLIAPMASSLM